MNMNERLMQFRIGMFVIVAGLVLTMMIIWFGESPSILRDQVYLTVHYTEAPGVLEGVPVRKSGIRIGEVSAIKFDDRPNQPDGVLVTLALERKYKILKGTRPRLSRSLIGDVTVDMQPGTGPEIQETSRSPLNPPIIDGDVAPDPSKALEAATKAFEKAGDTLQAINEAANGLSKLTKSAEKLDGFLASVTDAGKNVSQAAQGIDRVIKANEKDIQPAIASLRQVAQKLDDTLDAKTRDALKTGVDRFSSAAARLDAGIAQLDPVFKDLGAPVDKAPVTDLGQAVRRINLISSDLELLTKKLRDGRGGLNTAGSLQKLLTQSELHDNLNTMAVAATQAIGQLRVVLNALRIFAEKVSNDPSSLARGALRSN
jgi:phospholipid/cholesterol/gamma-HCH transport system substrate-binding protein